MLRSGAPFTRHSLIANGIDTPIDRPFPEAGGSTARGICVHLSSPKFLDERDGITFECETAVWHTLVEAKRQACLEYLCLLDRVWLPFDAHRGRGVARDLIS